MYTFLSAQLCKTAQRFYHISEHLAYDEMMIKNISRSKENKKKKTKQTPFGFEVHKLTNNPAYNLYMCWICSYTVREFKKREKENTRKGAESVLHMVDEVGLVGNNDLVKAKPHLYLDVGFGGRKLAEQLWNEKGIAVTAAVRDNAAGLPKENLDKGQKKVNKSKTSTVTVTYFHDNKNFRVISTAQVTKDNWYQLENIK